MKKLKLIGRFILYIIAMTIMLCLAFAMEALFATFFFSSILSKGLSPLTRVFLFCLGGVATVIWYKAFFLDLKNILKIHWQSVKGYEEDKK